MSNIYENLNKLVINLNADAVDKTASVMILENLIRDLIKHNIPEDQQLSASNIVERYKDKVESGDLKYASGFFGHWAKSVADSKK